MHTFIRTIDSYCEKLGDRAKRTITPCQWKRTPDTSFTPCGAMRVARRTYVIRGPLDSKIAAGMTWRGLTETSGNRISASRRIRACLHTRLYVSYSRNAAKDIRNEVPSITPGCAKWNRSRCEYICARELRQGEERSRRIIESRVLIEFHASAG